MSSLQQDDLLARERQRENQHLTQEAMIAHQQWRAAEAEALRCRKLFEQAAARLVPRRAELSQVAA